jgi:hypothetical protein
MNGIVVKRTCGARWHIKEPLASFFFDEDIITSTSFLNTLENYALPQLINNNLEECRFLGCDAV